MYVRLEFDMFCTQKTHLSYDGSVRRLIECMQYSSSLTAQVRDLWYWGRPSNRQAKRWMDAEVTGVEDPGPQAGGGSEVRAGAGEAENHALVHPGPPYSHTSENHWHTIDEGEHVNVSEKSI